MHECDFHWQLIFRFFSIGIFYILLPLNQTAAKGKKIGKRESVMPSYFEKTDTPTDHERQNRVQTALIRYAQLSLLLEREQNLAKLAKAIVQKPLKTSPVTMWNKIEGYQTVLGVLFSFLLSERIYRTIIEAIDPYETIQYRNFENKPETLDEATITAMAIEMRNRRIGAGVSVAEIGGNVTCAVMEALGAQTAFTDAGYRGSSVPFTLWQKASDFLSSRDDLVTLDHYTHKFSGTFDFTISNRVLDPGSGVEAIAEGHGGSSITVGAMELLAIYANITKNGGYSIHGGMTVDVADAFLDYLGFDIVHKLDRGKESVTILVKRECNPERYLNGVRIGYKTILYNPETYTFALKK
jgi:hypothetical protein